MSEEVPVSCPHASWRVFRRRSRRVRWQCRQCLHVDPWVVWNQ